MVLWSKYPDLIGTTLQYRKSTSTKTTYKPEPKTLPKPTTNTRKTTKLCKTKW